MPCADPEADFHGSSITEAPPATAGSLSPSCRMRQAICTASRPEEHAESTAAAGPCTLRVSAIRPDAKLKLLPVNPYGPSRARASAASNA